MNPGGITSPGVHPHGVVTSLEWLNAPTEEHLQQIHAGDTLVDQLNYSLDQHARLRLLHGGHFQRRWSLNTIKRERGKSSRLAWGHDILAIEPGQLPAPDRLRKSHRREGTPLPLLNTQTPTHLDNMGFLVVRVRFFHCFGADGENVLEETPVRSTPQKIIAHGHECGKVCDGVGSEMVELSPKEIQEPTEENTRRQGEPTVYVSG